MKITMHSAHSPNDPKAIRAEKLYNGGVILELNSPEVAQWLRRENTISAQEIEGMSVVKDRVTTMIIKYVPISHSPDSLAENQRINRIQG